MGQIAYDPILRIGGIKIYPFYNTDFVTDIGGDFLDEIEDNFYPSYLYAEPNEQK